MAGNNISNFEKCKNPRKTQSQTRGGYDALSHQSPPQPLPVMVFALLFILAICLAISVPDFRRVGPERFNGELEIVSFNINRGNPIYLKIIRAIRRV